MQRYYPVKLDTDAQQPAFEAPFDSFPYNAAANDVKDSRGGEALPPKRRDCVSVLPPASRQLAKSGRANLSSGRTVPGDDQDYINTMLPPECIDGGLAQLVERSLSTCLNCERSRVRLMQSPLSFFWHSSRLFFFFGPSSFAWSTSRDASHRCQTLIDHGRIRRICSAVTDSTNIVNGGVGDAAGQPCVRRRRSSVRSSAQTRCRPQRRTLGCERHRPG